MLVVAVSAKLAIGVTTFTLAGRVRVRVNVRLRVRVFESTSRIMYDLALFTPER